MLLTITAVQFSSYLLGYTSPAEWQQLVFGRDSADSLLLERMRELIVADH